MKGVVTAVPLGAVLLLEKSHKFKVRLVGPVPAAASAASAASAGVAAPAYAHSENKEVKEAQPPHSRETTVPAAAPMVIELDDSEEEAEEVEARVDAPGVRGLHSKPPPPAAEVVDLEAGAKPEKPGARHGEKPGARAAARREGKRTLAPPAEEEERARPRRPSAAPVPPAHEVIDLEAAAGVGVGVSGRPLLPGEQEARRRLQRRTWTLRASRSTEDTPEESHFRFAESAWCRGGGQAAQIESVEYHFSPQLEAAWHAKKAEYDARFREAHDPLRLPRHAAGQRQAHPKQWLPGVQGRLDHGCWLLRRGHLLLGAATDVAGLHPGQPRHVPVQAARGQAIPLPPAEWTRPRARLHLARLGRGGLGGTSD